MEVLRDGEREAERKRARGRVVFHVITCACMCIAVRMGLSHASWYVVILTISRLT